MRFVVVIGRKRRFQGQFGLTDGFGVDLEELVEYRSEKIVGGEVIGEFENSRPWEYPVNGSITGNIGVIGHPIRAPVQAVDRLAWARAENFSAALPKMSRGAAFSELLSLIGLGVRVLPPL